MGKMSDISIRLDEMKDNLYNYGFTNENFIQECKLLCELGFAAEVNCMIHDFENFIFNNV